MTQNRMDEIRRIVAEVLRGVFADSVRFGRIYMDADVDRDGMEYVTAHVIYESADESLDPDRMLDAMESVVDQVDALGESAFPVVTYVAKSEEEEWLGDRPRLP